jgi:hypothetical protein
VVVVKAVVVLVVLAAAAVVVVVVVVAAAKPKRLNPQSPKTHYTTACNIYILAMLIYIK